MFISLIFGHELEHKLPEIIVEMLAHPKPRQEHPG
jgi:hypothetical protein